MKLASYIAVLLVLAAAAGSAPSAGAQAPSLDWSSQNLNLDNNRFAPLDEIDASNVGGLVERWTWVAGPADNITQATPLVVDGQKLPMTASFGVATLSGDDTCLTDAIVRADRALYRSKREGRNRVDLESSQVLRTMDGVGSA